MQVAQRAARHHDPPVVLRATVALIARRIAERMEGCIALHEAAALLAPNVVLV